MRALIIGALEEAQARGANTKNVVAAGYCFGGAEHAFTVFGGERYHDQADRKSWDRFVKSLKTELSE